MVLAKKDQFKPRDSTAGSNMLSRALTINGLTCMRPFNLFLIGEGRKKVEVRSHNLKISLLVTQQI